VAAAAASCHRSNHAPFGPGEVECADGDVPGGRLVSIQPFVGEDVAHPFGEVYGDGLDARQLVDLSTLTPDALVQSPTAFYLRTAAPTDLPADGTIVVGGKVAAPYALTVEELLAQVRPIGVRQWECSGNGPQGAFGLMSAGDFAGVPLSWVLALVDPDADATMVRITGHDEHPPSTFSELGAAWVYHPDDLADAWLVTHQDGEPIPLDHGAPARLLVPGWYGCCNIKWVAEIAWVGDDEPATSQMLEFAARTHQDGAPALAVDYAPAESECSATVVRVERWEVDGNDVFRVVGVVWGGKQVPDALHLWMDDQDLGPVEGCGDRDPRTWGLWQSFLPTGAKGVVTLRCTAEGVPALRLDLRYYDRKVDLDA
jgi:DMSO/TMAO reductase YedYZ molybdopterin-dependent catalytic subunit